MTQREVSVRTFLHEYECDACHKGDMKPVKLNLTGPEPMYQHACETCGHIMFFPEKYPRVFYRIIDKEPMPWQS